MYFIRPQLTVTFIGSKSVDFFLNVSNSLDYRMSEKCRKINPCFQKPKMTFSIGLFYSISHEQFWPWGHPGFTEPGLYL